MDRESKYQDYTVEDFVQDDSFRNWVVSPSAVLNSYWIDFQSKYPEKKSAIELARQIVKSIIVIEEPLDEIEYQASLSFVKDYISNKNFRKSLVSKITEVWSKVAAVILIPVLLAGIYFYANYHFVNQDSGNLIQYIVPEGQKSNLLLADGTKVWLNSGTTLTVAANGYKNVRKVVLSGEAYFEVAKNKSVPFLVETKDFTIKVYGTSFNVSSYNYQKTSEAILKEGVISVVSGSDEEIKMVPGQRLLLNEEKRFNLSEVDPSLYTSWKDNVLKIDNEKLDDLIVRMEHWYGIRIYVDDLDRVKDLRYTLTIKTESLKEMLELMNYVVPFKYKIDGENIYLNYNLTNNKPME